MTACRTDDEPQPQEELRWSTGWNPVPLRTARPADAADLIAKGCRCKKDYRFVQWVLCGCPAAVIRLRPRLVKSAVEFVALLRHDALFQLLSRARAHPLDSSEVFRGVIDDENPDIFRVAASLEDPVRDAASDDWQATFKHHLAFVLQAEDLRSSGASEQHLSAATLWQKGVVNFIVSAPRSAAGRWRIKLGSGSPITGDCLLVVLSWVGNNYFGHEAIRRGVATPPFQRLAGEPGPDACGNVLQGLFTQKVIGQYVVRLDTEQLAALDEMNSSTDPLFCISALAGTGKTALAHCVLKAFIEEHRKASPRQLVLYAVPTRTLREEVVLELLKFKAALVSVLFLCVLR